MHVRFIFSRIRTRISYPCPESFSMRTVSTSNFIMSIIKAEPVDPCISVAIATGRPKLEIVVDDETVVKTDPDSVAYNGPFVKDVSYVKEEPLNDDTVYFVLSSFLRVYCMPFTGNSENAQT